MKLPDEDEKYIAECRYRNATAHQHWAVEQSRELIGIITRLTQGAQAESGSKVTHQDLRDFYSEWTSHEAGADKKFADALLPIIEGKVSVASWINGQDVPPPPEQGV